MSSSSQITLTFKEELTEMFHGMSNSDSLEISSLLKVLVENFIFMFLSASGVGFTLSSVGVMNPRHDIYVFTLAFSTFWGFVGAAAAWSRTNEDIRTPQLFKDLLQAVGVEKSTSDKCKEAVDYVRESFARRLFVPFVHSPQC